MAKAAVKRTGSSATVVLLLIAIITVLFGGMMWFQYLGIVDAESLIRPLAGRLPYVGKYFRYPVISSSLLKEERISKLKQSITMREEALQKRELELEEKDKAVLLREKQIESDRREIEEELKALEANKKRYDETEYKYSMLAKYYSNMKPENSAAIIEAMDDLLVVDILQRMDPQAVSRILMSLSAEKAGGIMRRMSQ